jgi:hypothetical protein
MQVTDEMVEAAHEAQFSLLPPFARPYPRLTLRAILQAALDAMPKATGGLIADPVPMPRAGCQGEGYLLPADVTPPPKVRDAADKLPGLTFNLNQEYGGMDEAALKKLRVNVRDNGNQDEDALPQAADG